MKKKKIPEASEIEDEELSPEDARARRKAARKRRILRNRLIFVGIVLLVVGAVAFRIFVVAKTINVTNETPYPDERLLASLNEGKGTFLFSFSSDKIENELKNLYPYVGSVEVKKHFPTTVDLIFHKAERAYAFSVGGEYVFTDGELRVLEVSKNFDGSVLLISGADIGDFEVGKTIDTEVFIYGDFIERVLAQAESSGVGSVTRIDITKKYRIAILLNETVTVVLGDFGDLDKKFDTLKYILSENDASVPATVNVKDYKRGKYALGSEIFSDEPENPSSTEPETTVPNGSEPPTSTESGQAPETERQTSSAMQNPTEP